MRGQKSLEVFDFITPTSQFITRETVCMHFAKSLLWCFCSQSWQEKVVHTPQIENQERGLGEVKVIKHLRSVLVTQELSTEIVSASWSVWMFWPVSPHQEPQSEGGGT